MIARTVQEPQPIDNLPDAVRAFYDPNDFFEQGHAGDNKLLEWVDKKREMPLVLPRIGSVATRQLVALELAHAGIVDESNIGAQGWLDINTAETEEALEAAQATASDTADYCLAAITKIRRSRPSSVLKSTSDVTLAGAVLAANAHKGQRRVVGDRPYYTHPRDVALLLHTSFQMHLSHSTDEQEGWLHEFKGLMHDGFEDAFSKSGRSFLASPNIITSPLVVNETLRRLDVDSDTAHRIAIGILALTKTVGPDGRMIYDAYKNRFALHIEEIPDKLADLQHNFRLDAKLPDLYDTEKNRKLFIQQDDYDQSQQDLLRYYSNSDNVGGSDWLGHQLFASKIITLTKADLHAAQRRSAWANIPDFSLIEAYEEAAA